MALPVAWVPELVEAWRDSRPYSGLRVRDLCSGVMGQHFGQAYMLRCAANHKLDTVVSSYLFTGCPWCRGNATRKVSIAKNVAEEDPELAALWHPTKNGDLKPESTAPGHRKPLWWKASHCCGYEWKEAISQRILGRRPQAGRGHYYCPRCESVWGSLAWLDPELATEWRSANELTPWHVKPFSGGVVAKWRCSANPEHVWDASVIDRSSGRLCPLCSTAGTSHIEKAFLDAAQVHDREAEAVRIGRWKVDVLVPSARLVIEYDGVYWHRDKQDVDLRKSRDLMEAGYRVARIRENDLPHLDFADANLRQVTFWPANGRVEDTVDQLLAWAAEPS